jgi:hypothetical protein
MISLWVGWFLVSCLGSALHFAFKWLGCGLYLIPFLAVNESVWEHLKLLVWPLLLWWAASLCWRDPDDCLHGLVVSELYSVSTLLVCYYTYMGIVDYESLVVDIVLFVLGVFVGLFVAESTPLYPRLGLQIAAVLFFVGFITLSLCKPALPLFYDRSHGTYDPVC